jgi:FkbM family methyltransferase
MVWISYAQNFEDVILMRALSDVKNGFYIDVGAQHPRVDSVSRAFYEKGWRGIHVEPVSAYVQALAADRPDEAVVQAMLGGCKGATHFYEIPQTGLSTAVESIARKHIARGFSVVEIEVEQTNLDAVFQLAKGRDIHWLKIDVEGSEHLVLGGWLRNPSRPWVVVVESTFPLSQVESHQSWEPYLLRRGYRFVYFDGINRFYLHRDHLNLKPAFNHGPCVFDGFALSGLASSPFCYQVIHQAQAALTD